MRVHRQVFQAAAVEDAAVGSVVLGVGRVEPGAVHVKGVRILHGEAADAHQPGLGPRLVTELGLDLVPDLRQLLVAPQLAAGEEGDNLFFRHAQAVFAAPPVVEAEHVAADRVPAAALFPDFSGMQFGRVDLLRADGVHFLPDDALDLAQRALGQVEVAIQPGGQLADVAGPQQQLVAGDLGFGGIVPERRDIQAAPAHGERSWNAGARPSGG